MVKGCPEWYKAESEGVWELDGKGQGQVQVSRNSGQWGQGCGDIGKGDRAQC